MRPKREDGDDDTDNDGIPNDFDPFDNEHPQDGVTKKDLQFDGRYVEGGPLHPITDPEGGPVTRSARTRPPSSSTSTSGGSSA